MAWCGNYILISINILIYCVLCGFRYCITISCKLNIMPKRSRLFQLNEKVIDQILLCDNSDSEEDLALDDEDINFLATDVEYAEKNLATDQVLESTINPPSASPVNAAQNSEHASTDKQSSAVPLLATNSTFKWKKLNPQSQAAIVAQRNLHQSDENDYGEVLVDVSEELSPYQIFNKLNLSNFSLKLLFLKAACMLKKVMCFLHL